jgi:hypothetical protein
VCRIILRDSTINFIIKLYLMILNNNIFFHTIELNLAVGNRSGPTLPSNLSSASHFVDADAAHQPTTKPYRDRPAGPTRPLAAVNGSKEKPTCLAGCLALRAWRCLVPCLRGARSANPPGILCQMWIEFPSVDLKKIYQS